MISEIKPDLLLGCIDKMILLSKARLLRMSGHTDINLRFWHGAGRSTKRY